MGSQLGPVDFHSFDLNCRFVPTLAVLRQANPDGWIPGSKTLRMKIRQLLKTYNTSIIKHKGKVSDVSHKQSRSYKLLTALRAHYYNSHNYELNIKVQNNRYYRYVSSTAAITGRSDHAIVYAVHPDYPKLGQYALAIWQKFDRPLLQEECAQVVYDSTNICMLYWLIIRYMSHTLVCMCTYISMH